MWVIARTARKRPTLMHMLNPDSYGMTMCGVNVEGWSRAVFQSPIPQVTCLRCKIYA